MTTGLNIDSGVTFAFFPSILITAAEVYKFGLDIRSFREPLKRAIQQVIAPSFARNFAEGGRPDSWEPLTDVAVKMREYYGFSADPVLVRTGLLRRTVQQFNIWTVTTDQAALTNFPSKIWYASIQQEGLPSRNIPARPFILLQDPEDYDKIEEIFALWLLERMARAGL